MIGPMPCGSDADPVVFHRVVGLIKQRLAPGDRRGQETRRSDLLRQVLCLPPPAADALLIRLTVPHPHDPLTRPFQRLPHPCREALLVALRRAAAVAPLIAQDRNLATAASLSPVVARLMYVAEVREAVAQVGTLAVEQQYAQALNALAQLEQVNTDPRFETVDHALRATMAAESARLHALLVTLRRPALRPANSPGPAVGYLDVPAGAGLLAGETAAAAGAAAAGTAAGAGIAAGAGAAAAALLPLVLGVAVVTIGAIAIYGHVRGRVPVIGSELALRVAALGSLAQALGELRRTAEVAAARRPQTLDWPGTGTVPDLFLPPEEQDDQRRRCRQEWVGRLYGPPWNVYYHDMYATAIVERLRLDRFGVDPHTELRLYRSSGFRDYDSYDPSRNAYLEFKTKHDYLAEEGLNRKGRDVYVGWMARVRFFEQVDGQREDLIRCGLSDAKLIWYFEKKEAAEHAKRLLAGRVDKVLHEPWEGPRKRR